MSNDTYQLKVLEPPKEFLGSPRQHLLSKGTRETLVNTNRLIFLLRENSDYG